MKQRKVSVELLRIVAMLMVLTLHANFMGIGIPTPETVITPEGIIRIFLQSVCICAVDTFIMISGWFGIRPSFRGFCNFMWQVVYIVGLLQIAEIFFFDVSLNYKIVLKMFGLYGGGGWFVASYVGLYIITPVLNTYVEKTAPHNIALMLGAFFMFEILWSNTLSVGFVMGGYSAFSFIGVYILAGLLRKIQSDFFNTRVYWGLFFISVSINAIMYIYSVYSGAIAIRDMLFNYINPIVIIASATLLLAFTTNSMFTPPLKHTHTCIQTHCALACIIVLCGISVTCRN